MGAWSQFEILSGSDGALRLALQLCDAAGNDYTTWPDDVQEYSHLKPDYDGAGVVCTLQAVTPRGPASIVCQALPETYKQIVEVIDSTTAEMWSSIPGFMGYIEFINTPGTSCQSCGRFVL